MTKNYSIIIPTYNRISWLQKSIQALLEQMKSNDIEIIILDDGSADGTPEFISSLAESYPFIRVVLQHGCGPAHLRNIGAKLSQGRFLCFLDDDSVVEPKWLEELMVGANNLKPPYAAIKGFVHAYQNSPLPVFLGKYIHLSDSWATNNIAFAREPFTQAGGFDEQFTFAAWEDLDLGYRLERMGYRRWYNPDMIIRHPHEETIDKLKRKFKINGYGFSNFAENG